MSSSFRGLWPVNNKDFGQDVQPECMNRITFTPTVGEGADPATLLPTDQGVCQRYHG